MKRIERLIITCLLALCPAICVAQSPEQNYLLNHTFTTADGSSSRQQVTYYDGLGRPVQTTDIGITPTRQDLVSLQEYDSRGRKSYSWLPVQQAGNGSFLDVALLKQQAVEQYGGDTRPFEQRVYESYPTPRIQQMYLPGEAWKNRPINYAYGIDEPRWMFRIEEIAHIPWGSYPYERVADEDGRISYSFTDGIHREILTGQLNKDTIHYVCYEYDYHDDLVNVHSPMATTPLLVFDNRDKLEKNFSSMYRYNPFHQRASEDLPGRDSIYYMYDKGERLIFSQDGEQRQRGEWTFMLPDVFGRTLLTGFCKAWYYFDDFPFIDIVTEAKRTNAENHLYGHEFSGLTMNDTVLFSVNFYDDYEFVGRNGIPSSLQYAVPPAGYGTWYADGSQGLLTGTVATRMAVDGMSGNDYTTFYYDDRGRMIQKRSTNHLGGLDVEYVAYNFIGDVVKHMRVHSSAGGDDLTEVCSYRYDHAGRLLSMQHQLNGKAEVVLATCAYDELGRLQSKEFHGGSADRLNYSYNIRNWLTSISGTHFSQQLHYTDGPGTPQYNGNISSMTWQAGDEPTIRGYRFTYDGLNRLQTAVYGEGTSLADNRNGFTEKVVGYDLNGNILGLQRYGQTESGDYGLLDNLTYKLYGNKVTRVDDTLSVSVGNGGFEFTDGAKQADEYTYDRNGNLAKDLNRNIIDIQYNFLNLPCKVVFAGGDSIIYVYASDGTKLRSVSVIGGVTTTTDYCGNVIYENGVRKLLLTEAGYITLKDGKHHYYLQDHQGNNRVVVDEDGTVEEVNHYYPFGGVFASSANVQPYKYNGKELEKPQQWYDYGARRYDAVLGRFTSQDPLAEKAYPWSPYAYCYDNPVLHVDPTGKFGETVWDIFNVVLGFNSLKNNLSDGNYGAALVDGVGMVFDAGSAMLPFVPGGAGAAIKGARAADKTIDAVLVADKARDVVHATTKSEQAGEVATIASHVSGKLTIDIAPENKIDRSLLNPPAKRGNAPTFKDTKEPVEIHHVGQNPNGPFKEMSSQEHRGKGNFKKNHPYLGEPSKIDRNEFNKAKEEYWKKEYGQ